MRCAAAVGVNDDLTAGQAGVALRSADHKAAGGIDIDLGVLVQQLSRNGGLDDQLNHILADLLQRSLGAMLGGQHHRIHAHGLAALIVLHRDLGLAVGTQVVHQTGLTHLGQLLGHLVRKRDGQRHQLRRFIAGITEHHALIAGAVIQLAVAGLFRLQGSVNAHGDVAGLLVDVGDNAAGIAVKAVLGAVIADLTHHLAGDLGNIHIAGGGDLTHDMDQTGGSGGFTGHAAIGVMRQNGIQHGIRDLIANFVGMTLGDGFGSKQSSCHSFRAPFTIKFCFSPIIFCSEH